MTPDILRKRIEIAQGKRPADTVIKNAKIVNVYSHDITEGDIAISDGVIAGIGTYSGVNEINADGCYAIPGLIDSHIHIESSFLSPEEFGRMVVPFGTTTIIADPHEIVNVCGEEGFRYMLEAAKRTALDIKFMVPSCVPCSPFENSGAVIDAKTVAELLQNENVIGLAEFMNYVGVINGDEECLNKISAALNQNKRIDGHAPGLLGAGRQAYISTGILTDHECSTIEEMHQSIANGMFVELRNGSACHNLYVLIKGITPNNSRRCLLCSDDMQPVTLFENGHINGDIKACVEEGLDPITAIQMGSLNAAECYGLTDRGAISAGKRADIVLTDNLTDFNVRKVFINGILTAENGTYLPQITKQDISAVSGSVHIDKFSSDKLRLPLRSQNVKAIGIIPGNIVTKCINAEVTIGDDGCFKFDPKHDIVKIAVIERHHNTGNVGLGLLTGYGIRHGAIAITIAHDSHNIIAVGVSDEEMTLAIKTLAKQGGGIVLVKDGKVLDSMPLPIAGLMCDKDARTVEADLKRINTAAHEQLGVDTYIEPISTLCFMSLPVIPELKVTDKGLFDVRRFEFTGIET
ncbi:MAG: adenine deaminase [Spirochaetales bacterium]|nr:adenine deaminase [Spirochaetales bacterium]